MNGSLPAALITGAANRIGRAIAVELASHGTPVAVHYNRSADAASALITDIEKAGGTAVAISADLLKADQAHAVIGDASRALGEPIGCLINNASIFAKDEVGSLSADLFEAHFAIHATVPALLSDAMVNQLPASEDGLVVNIIDQRVWRLTPHFPSYTASKAALWCLTQTLAQAYAETTQGRVRVNAIGPGPTLANERQQPEDFQAQLDGIPLGRGAQLRDFGTTIQYLWAMRSITGQMVALDGGQHLSWQTPDVLNANE
ncbi:MAG: SDR family oxidoreductase [Pseudomonadota bacterium]